MDDCIFCQIVKRKIPVKIIRETEKVVAFPDISPSADLHIIIIPKQHIDSVVHLKMETSGEVLSEIYAMVKTLVMDNDLLNKPYRIVVNGGSAQHVPHLHFHLLGGKWKRMV